MSTAYYRMDLYERRLEEVCMFQTKLWCYQSSYSKFIGIVCLYSCLQGKMNYIMASFVKESPCVKDQGFITFTWSTVSKFLAGIFAASLFVSLPDCVLHFDRELANVFLGKLSTGYQDFFFLVNFKQKCYCTIFNFTESPKIILLPFLNQRQYCKLQGATRLGLIVRQIKHKALFPFVLHLQENELDQISPGYDGWLALATQSWLTTSRVFFYRKLDLFVNGLVKPLPLHSPSPHQPFTTQAKPQDQLSTFTQLSLISLFLGTCNKLLWLGHGNNSHCLCL